MSTVVTFCDLPLHLKQYIYKIAYRSEHLDKMNNIFPELLLTQAFYEMDLNSSAGADFFHTWLRSNDIYDLKRLYDTLSTCKCCQRHQIARPCFNSNTSPHVGLDTGVSYIKSNNCQCQCRHFMRWLVEAKIEKCRNVSQ